MVKTFIKNGVLLLIVFLASIFCCAFNCLDNKLNINAKQLSLIEEDEFYLTDSESNVVVTSSNFSKGTVDGGGRYEVGELAKIIATPADGCYLVNWQIKSGENFIDLVVDGELQTELEYSFIVDGDYEFKAVFEFCAYDLYIDFTNVFELTNLNYSYDENRFSEENIQSYPRASISNFEDGKFYYNDIVCLNYSQVQDTYIKKLNVSDLYSSDKKIFVVNINTEGKLVSSVSNGQTTNYESDLTLNDFEFDYENYNYFILTQKDLKTSNYSTINIELRFKLKGDTEFSAQTNKLTNLTLSAMELINDETVDLDINEVQSLIDYEYGYYGIVDNESFSYLYLVEVGANFSLKINSNSFYSYQYAITSKYDHSTSVTGYYSGIMTEIVVVFERVKYEVNFVELERISTTNIVLEEDFGNLLDIDTQFVYPGESVVFDIQNLILNVVGVNKNLTFNEIFGYEVFAISLNNKIDEKILSPITANISNDQPENITIYIVYQKIEYNVQFLAVDITGTENAYFENQLISFSEDTTVVRNDNIVLGYMLKFGYVALGWKSDLDGDYLSETTIKFEPSSNENKSLNYYLFIDYDYSCLSYNLSSSSILEDQTHMADLAIDIIKYFTFNQATGVLEAYGVSAVDENFSNESLIISQTLTSTSEIIDGGKTIYTYSSSFGEIKVSKSTDFEKLECCNVVFNYEDGEFVLYNSNTKKDVVITFNNSDGVYGFELTNLTVNDLVVLRSKTTDSTYRFAYLTQDGKSTLTITNSKFFDNENYYFYTCFIDDDKEITAVYAYKTQSIIITTNNADAYSLNNVEIGLTGTASSTIENGYINIVAEIGNVITISIDSANISQGYRFIKFVRLYEDSGFLQEDLIFSSIDDNFQVSLTMSNSMAGSNIILMFEEISYTVNVSYIGETADVLYTSNIGVESEVVSSSFTIKISDAIHNPTLFVNSKIGYYVSNAYINLNLDENKIHALIGDKSQQTNIQLNLGGEMLSATIFKLFIMDKADNNDSVNLFIVQQPRAFTITVVYHIENETSAYFSSQASVNCLHDHYEESFTATYKDYLDEKAYIVEFNNISFNQTAYLSVYDGGLEGLFFSSWQQPNGVILSEEKDMSILVDSNIVVVLSFQRIMFNIRYKTVDSNGVESSMGRAEFSVNDINSSTCYYGDLINITVVENAGYKFERIYYKKGGYEFTTGIESSSNMSYYIESFRPLIFLFSTRDQQISNAEARNFIIYIQFSEKLYTISTTPTNVTIGDQNLSGIAVEDWIDADSLTVKYLDDESGTYIYKTETDGVVKYKTNENIEIRFNSSFNGIRFVRLELGVDSYIINSTGDISLAGQQINFITDDEKGDNYYILRFCLNTYLLDSVGSGDDFNIKICYELKRYIVSLTSNIIESNLKYNLNLSYTYGIDGVSLTDQKITIKNLYYGSNVAWTISYEANNPFKDIYTFSYFATGEHKFKEIKYSMNSQTPNTMQFSMNEIVDEAGNTIWNLIEDSDDAVTIFAFYSPKITLNSSSFIYDVNTDTYLKTTTYNAKKQRLTTSYDSSVSNPDIVYPLELGAITILYNGSSSNYPINANYYDIKIILSGVNFDQKVGLRIKKQTLTLEYGGAIISKVYDGTNILTNDNLTLLRSQFNIKGLQSNEEGIVDVVDIGISELTGYYMKDVVGENIDITLTGLEIDSHLNYEFTNIESISPLTGKGEIVKKELNLISSGFVFENIVKKGNEPILKYNIAENLAFRETLPTSLTQEVYVDLEKVEMILNNYTIGEQRMVEVRLNDSLGGADSSNYTLANVYYYIDIHPYEITTQILNVGSVSIVDKEEKCIIPITVSETESLKVDFIDSTHERYPSLFSAIERTIQNDEKLVGFLDIDITTTKGNKLDLNVLSGCYLNIKLNDYRPSKIYSMGTNIEDVDFDSKLDGVSVLIDEKLSNTLTILTAKSYFAIWKIILIIVIILLILLAIIIGFIIFKRKLAKKRKQNEPH